MRIDLNNYRIKYLIANFNTCYKGNIGDAGEGRVLWILFFKTEWDGFGELWTSDMIYIKSKSFADMCKIYPKDPCQEAIAETDCLGQSRYQGLGDNKRMIIVVDALI